MGLDAVVAVIHHPFWFAGIFCDMTDRANLPFLRHRFGFDDKADILVVALKSRRIMFAHALVGVARALVVVRCHGSCVVRGVSGWGRELGVE